MRRLFLILVSAMLLMTMLSSCGNDKESNNAENTQATEPTEATRKKEKPTEPATEPATEEIINVYTDIDDEPESPFEDVDKNCNTDAQITNFEYMTEEREADFPGQGGSYDNVLTCYIKDRVDSNSGTMHYLIDLKLGIIYYSSNPDNWYDADDYSDEKELTSQEISNVISALKNADTQGWDDIEPSNNSNCDRLSDIILEYENGKIEKRSVVCKACDTVDGFEDIADTVAKIAKGYKCDDCGQTHIEGEIPECQQNQESSTQSAEGEEGYFYHHHTTIYFYDC